MSARQTETCAEMNALLAERASGPLEAPEASALDAHLLRCEACQSAAEEYESLFSLLALPPPSLKEEAALRGLAERTLAAWQKGQRRWRAAGGLLLAASVLCAAVLPLWVWQAAPAPAVTVAAVQRLSAVQPASTDTSNWVVDEPAASDGDATSDDSPVLDGLALEGDGAFALGDSG